MGNVQRKIKAPTGCFICGNALHYRSDFTNILTAANRHEHLKRSKLCYNCTRAGHSVSNCWSRNCYRCGEKHNTSHVTSIMLQCLKTLQILRQVKYGDSFCVLYQNGFGKKGSWLISSGNFCIVCETLVNCHLFWLCSSWFVLQSFAEMYVLPAAMSGSAQHSMPFTSTNRTGYITEATPVATKIC